MVFIASLVLLAIFVSLNSYWWFIDYNLEALRICNFSFIIVQSVLWMLTSGLYLATICML